jgi:hypothetical protein
MTTSLAGKGFEATGNSALTLLPAFVSLRLSASRFPQYKLFEGLVRDIGWGLPVEVDVYAQALNLRVECRGFQSQQPSGAGLIAIALAQGIADQLTFVVFNHIKKVLGLCCRRYHLRLRIHFQFERAATAPDSVTSPFD